MSTARDDILNAIRRRTRHDGEDDLIRRRGLEARIQTHRRNLIPSRIDGDHAGHVALFKEWAVKHAATVVSLETMNEVPAAVSDYLRSNNLPQNVKTSPDASVKDLDWADQPQLEVAHGRADGTETTSVTPAFCGVAETGTLMLTSGPTTPNTLNFLPASHIVVLRESQIVGGYEDAWDRLRERYGNGQMPRSVNYITGPSRTGDIDMKIEMGAHGPKRLHILVVKD